MKVIEINKRTIKPIEFPPSNLDLTNIDIRVLNFPRNPIGFNRLRDVYWANIVWL